MRSLLERIERTGSIRKPKSVGQWGLYRRVKGSSEASKALTKATNNEFKNTSGTSKLLLRVLKFSTKFFPKYRLSIVLKTKLLSFVIPKTIKISGPIDNRLIITNNI